MLLDEIVCVEESSGSCTFIWEENRCRNNKYARGIKAVMNVPVSKVTMLNSRGVNGNGHADQAGDDIDEPMRKVGSYESQVVILPGIFMAVVPRSRNPLGARDGNEG